MNGIIRLCLFVLLFKFLLLLRSTKCQKSANILFGKKVDISDYPYQVGILNTKFNRLICGGVIIKPNVVFTAAHCTHTRTLQPRKNLAVLAGANTVNDKDRSIHHIAKVVKHPSFNYQRLDSDISVLLLKEPIKFNDKAQAIEISTDEFPGGTKAWVSGWGRTETGLPSTNLRAVDVELDDNHKCQTYFPHILHPIITDNMVCLKPHIKSSYHGDSGGPLTVNGKLAGLVSFGRILKPDKKTTVFTKVGNFVDFLDDVLYDEGHESH